MQNKKIKSIPNFKSEKEEREFWAKHDSSQYIDWSQAIENPVFPELKPSTETISLRLPKYLLERLKEMANAQDVPYQSLMKIYLSNQIKKQTKL